MDIEKLFELLDDKEKEEMFKCVYKWKSKKELVLNTGTLTDLHSWTIEHKKMSTRLTRCLLFGYREQLFRFVEEVEEEGFMKMRAAGKGSWLEFIELRDSDIEIVMPKTTDSIND